METTSMTMQRIRLKLIKNLFKEQPSLYINAEKQYVFDKSLLVIS